MCAKFILKCWKKLFAEYKNLIIFGEKMCWNICWLCAFKFVPIAQKFLWFSAGKFGNDPKNAEFLAILRINMKITEYLRNFKEFKMCARTFLTANFDVFDPFG